MAGVNIPSVDTSARRGGSSDAIASATADLLWASCRPVPDLRAAEEARAGGADLDWASQVSVAQRVSPLLWRVAQGWATEGEHWPERLRDDTLRCRAQSLMVRPRLRSTLLDPLADAGVETMLIKGAALADRYPEPGLRPMDDVDILVRAGQHHDAAEALRRAGWQPTRRQGPEYSSSLAHPSMPGLPVDLHHELAVPAESVFRFTAADLWAASRGAPRFGALTSVPSPEVELLLLATHAGKPYHNFDRLLWAVDAAVIIQGPARGEEPIDWDALEALSSRAAARSALAVLLSQAERLGATSPPGLRRPAAEGTRRRALGPPLSAAWPLERLDRPARDRLTYAVIDDPRLRVRRLGYEIVEDGPLRAPVRAAVLIFRILRRIWRFRRGTPHASPEPPAPRAGAGLPPQAVSAEERDEQVDPVLGDREP